ncbi:MAG: copper amine oxidase N-terminal domain-containing protein [Clostridiales bacterium]|nr:copper amine oxidase N-terminal domain-containing protein [Clostridiales bacterium]
MHIQKRALLAAGLIAGAAALTGCTAQTKPVTTPTPMAMQQQTAQPATAQPETAQPSPQATISVSEAPDSDESPAPLKLLVGGDEADTGAIEEQDELLLPLIETAEKLGWKAEDERSGEETQEKRVITLEKDDSRITVSWTVSDNTAKNISWQKDGLLIPVDARLTTLDDVVYVPAAFFEEAMEVSVANQQTNVIVSTPKPSDTPKLTEDSSGENG